MATMNISLPQQMKDWIEEQVATGRYANASDYLRDLIRDEFERETAEATFLALVDEGLASGVSELTPRDVLAQAKAEAAAISAKKAG